MHHVPVVAHEPGDEFVGGPHLLQGHHIGLAGGEPSVHPVLRCGAQPVHIHRGDGDHRCQPVTLVPELQEVYR